MSRRAGLALLSIAMLFAGVAPAHAQASSTQVVASTEIGGSVNIRVLQDQGLPTERRSEEARAAKPVPPAAGKHKISHTEKQGYKAAGEFAQPESGNGSEKVGGSAGQPNVVDEPPRTPIADPDLRTSLALGDKSASSTVRSATPAPTHSQPAAAPAAPDDRKRTRTKRCHDADAHLDRLEKRYPDRAFPRLGRAYERYCGDRVEPRSIPAEPKETQSIGDGSVKEQDKE